MELNAEQIIKALECCAIRKMCTDCPYFEKYCKMGSLHRLEVDALALIKELTTKTEAQDIVISELRHRVEKAEHDAERYSKKIKELTEENERLQKNKESVAIVCKRAEEHYDTLYEQAKDILKAEVKADTVRRLHERFKSDPNLVYSNYNIHRYIDQVAREMLEEKQNDISTKT